MIWIIGGTSEAGQLVRMLKGKIDYLITVATETGREFLEGETNLKIGRRNLSEMIKLIRDKNITKIVDLSHPYATEVSENAVKAARETECDYLRYTRLQSQIENAIVVPSMEACRDYLGAISGTVFFTTGSNHIGLFQGIRKENRFVFRILPSRESLAVCSDHGVSIKDIVAVLGPFSIEMNTAMFKEYGADYVVMKNSGPQGGTREKLKACEMLNITPIIVERPEETGFADLDDLMKELISG